MNSFIRIDVNLLSLVLLSIIFINIKRNSESHLIHTKLFITMLYVNASLLLLDILSVFIDGKPGTLLLILNISLNVFYFIVAPLAACLWLFYVDYHIFDDEDRLRKLKIYYLSPVLINVVFVFISLFNGFIFHIDSSNIYNRGPGHYTMYILVFGTILYTLFLSYNNRKIVDSRDLFGLQLFIVPIVIGSIIQIVYQDISLTWTAMSISLLIVFTTIEMRKIYRDYLTGAHSRRQLDEYINYRLRLSKKTKGFIIAMIDMDDFKKINDTYGHHEGDQALVELVRLLKLSVRRSDFIARFAGDEFVIIFDFEEQHLFDFVLNRILESVHEFNDEHPDSYQLKFSIGTEIIHKNESRSYDEIFKIIDAKMYEQKNLKKNTSRN